MTALGVGLLKVVVIIITVVAAADAVGLPYEGVLTGLGIGGLALAFAARETVSNMLAAAILLVDRPFRRGDLIDVGGTMATLEAVGLRSTRLRTFDDSVMIVPNSQLSDQIDRQLGRKAATQSYAGDRPHLRHPARPVARARAGADALPSINATTSRHFLLAGSAPSRICPIGTSGTHSD